MVKRLSKTKGGRWSIYFSFDGIPVLTFSSSHGKCVWRKGEGGWKLVKKTTPSMIWIGKKIRNFAEKEILKFQVRRIQKCGSDAAKNAANSALKTRSFRELKSVISQYGGR